MRYLVRLLPQNTANERFWRSKFAENVPAKELLRHPKELINPAAAILSPARSRQILPAKILRSTCSRAGAEPDTPYRAAARRSDNILGRDTPFPPARV